MVNYEKSNSYLLFYSLHVGVVMKSLFSVSGFTFEIFSGDLVGAPSNPYLAHLEWLDQHLTGIGEHIKASRIRRLINAATDCGMRRFLWCDDIYPANCETY